MRLHQGFTLIEVMIVVVIISIIAGIAYPSYKKSVERTKRVEAQSRMLEIGQRLQAYKITQGSLKTATIHQFGDKIPLSGSTNYELKLTDEEGNPLATSAKAYTWQLTAEPKNSMDGTGALTLNHAGQQCWYKNKDTFTATDTCLAWSDK